MLLPGPVSHTSTQYIDFVEILNISLDFPTIYFVVADLPLCIIVTLFQTAVSCFLGSS